MSLASTIASWLLPPTESQTRTAGEFVLADTFQGTDSNYLAWISALVAP